MAEFQKLQDGSLILRGQKPSASPPGVLSGLRALIASRLRPAPAPEQWWIPPAPVAPAAPAPAVVAPSLPAYNQWSEVEGEAARMQRIKDELGPVSRKILASPQLIEGKWLK